jgi:hypothetical protein
MPPLNHQSAKSNTLLFGALFLTVQAACAASLPASISSKIPADFKVISYVSADLNGDAHPDYLVAISRKDEQAVYDKTSKAPARPLLLFISKPDGTFSAEKRNDLVIDRLDTGGQCDPFEGDGGLVAKGRYFTVQNGEACGGSHWTDYTTFRYDAATHDVVVYKRIMESWKMNDDTSPNAEPLVLDSRQIKDAVPGKPIAFDKYRPDPN